MSDIFPHDITPTSPATHIQENFEAWEARVPLDDDDIEAVCSCNINWADGCIVPIDNLPIDDIRDALSDSTNATFSTDFGFVGSGLLIQYRDNLNVYAFPGQVMHRGVFKRQPFDDTTGKVRVVLASAVLNNPAADGDPGTTSGLKADEWYYWYAKLDVATGYPDYRVTLVAPTNEDGYGLEHPTDTGMRYLGVMATGNAPEAYIVPFYRYANGRFIWRQIAIGPYLPTSSLVTAATVGFTPLDLTDWVPPTADAVFLSAYTAGSSNPLIQVAAGEDTNDPCGFSHKGFQSDEAESDSAWMEVPINMMDSITDEPTGQTEVRHSVSTAPNVNDALAAVGFHEPIS